MFLNILEDVAIVAGVISFCVVVSVILFVYFLSNPENYR